jgi:hypothetical protein
MASAAAGRFSTAFSANFSPLLPARRVLPSKPAMGSQDSCAAPLAKELDEGVDAFVVSHAIPVPVGIAHNQPERPSNAFGIDQALHVAE